VTILATGVAVHDAVAAANKLLAEDKIRARVLNVSCIRPFDAAAVLQAALETTHLIVVEDHHSEGGLATQVADVIADFQLLCSLRRLGVNQYFPSAMAEDLKLIAGLDVDSIMDAARDEVRSEVTGGEDAFVTIIYALLTTARQSRFRESVQTYIERIITEKEYLETLREKWKGRKAGKMPTTEELRRRLAE
jgi:hypothetical protein